MIIYIHCKNIQTKINCTMALSNCMNVLKEHCLRSVYGYIPYNKQNLLELTFVFVNPIVWIII